ncbi:MAG: SAM-dependent methyltransferase [Frankia sp.]|nr:SAM-dependent methyltransferase [Frankia sp.]
MIDQDRPSTSRVYDYFLGGQHNYPVDRALAEQLCLTLPDIGAIMRENRAFLRRVIRFLLAAGVRQFLDLGSGIPNQGNVHDLVGCARGRVVYVDIDPTAVETSLEVLADEANATIIQADLRDPASVLDHPQARRLLDLSEPVAVLLLGVLHDIPDRDDPWEIVRQYGDRMAPGSFLALSQGVAGTRPDSGGCATHAYNRGYADGAPRLSLRTREDTLAFFDGFELVAPGLVFIEDWRPKLAEDLAPLSAPKLPAHVPAPVPAPGHRAALGGVGLR